VPRCDAIKGDLSDGMLTGDRFTSRLVIDIPGKAYEIGMTLLLPFYSEVIDVYEVDHAPDQDDRQSKYRKERKISLLPGEPVVEQISAPSA